MDDARELNPVFYLERNAKDDPSGTFLAFPGQTVTNAEALENVRKIAYELRRVGVKAGDVVALDLPEALSILFTEAVFHEAAVSTMPPPGFDPSTFTIDWTFTSNPDASAAGQTVVVDDRFLEQVNQNPAGISARPYESADSLLWILYSSGTTGTPNAIAVTLGKLDDYAINAAETWMQGDPFLTFLNARTPLGLYAIYISVRNRHPHLALKPAEPAATVDLAARYGVTSIKASPAQLVSFVEALESQGRTLPAIGTIYTVGTSMAAALADRLRAVTEGCEIYSLYGATEAGMAFVRYYDSEDPFDVGQLFPGAEAEIVDDDDRPVPQGEVGRIRLRGPVMVHEYYGNPEAGRENFRDGWFYTGDLGSFRTDGGLTFEGRASEILNAGGVKVDPVRLDHFAVQRADVHDAASFTYATASGVDRIGIALVVDDGVDVQAIIDAFARQFGPAAPKLVARVPAIPRNAMGKPMRTTLAENYRES